MMTYATPGQLNRITKVIDTGELISISKIAEKNTEQYPSMMVYSYFNCNASIQKYYPLICIVYTKNFVNKM